MALRAEAVHSIIPVPGADQRQSMGPDCQSAVQCALAVLEQRAAPLGRIELRISIGFVGGEFIGIEERDFLVEDIKVTGRRDIDADNIRQPE